MAGRFEPTSSSAMARSLDLISAPLTRATTGSVFCAQADPAMTDVTAATRRSMRRGTGGCKMERRVGDSRRMTIVLAIRVVPCGAPLSEACDTWQPPLTQALEAKGHRQVYGSSAAFDLEFLKRGCGRRFRNFKSAALVPRGAGHSRNRPQLATKDSRFGANERVNFSSLPRQGGPRPVD